MVTVRDLYALHLAIDWIVPLLLGSSLRYQDTSSAGRQLHPLA
ncbi:hypothetical protein [Rothia uropygialis]|nr:hypothetical protein [Kocuria sp. 36]